MFRKHHILQLPLLPKDRKELQSMIALARHARRRRNLAYFAALNMVGWGLYILFIFP